MKHKIALASLMLVFFSCSEDATKKKRSSASGTADQNQQQQYNPNNQDGTMNPQQQQGPGSPQNGTFNKCENKTFDKTLTGDVQKNLTFVVIQGILEIPSSIDGAGTLEISNKADRLDLDISVDELQVEPQSGVAIAEPEIEKFTGLRSLFKATDLQLATLNEKGGVWSATNCLIGFTKSQTFPFGNGNSVTVEFSPALPFAPYPDKVGAELEAAIGSGATFSGITGKITEVKGDIDGFEVGNEYDGSVEITRNGDTYKSEFKFGGFSNLEKLGLFEYAAYTYSNGSISEVEVEAGILGGKDSINITFD